MKICFISSLYPPFILGGAEIIVKKEAEQLAKRGHEVLVITTSPNRKNYEEELNGVKIYRISPLNIYPMFNHQEKPMFIKPIWHLIDLWNPSSYFLTKKILNKEKPDVVHINNFKGLSLSVFSAVKSLKLPFIFTIHDYSLICPRANLLKSIGEICCDPSSFCRFYNRLQKFFANNKPDLVTSPSQFALNKLKEKGIFQQVRMIKLPLGIELEYKESLEKKYEQINILFVGALNRHKGVHILINAFKRLKHDNIKLNVVGKGAEESILKKIAESDPRIIFHGFVHEERIYEIYKNANLTVVPSIWYENSPMVIYESFKFGTPVLGSKIGGIPELIEDGYNGLLFKPGSVDELSSILWELINDHKKLNILEKGAVESAKKYDIKKHVSELEKMYGGLQHR